MTPACPPSRLAPPPATSGGGLLCHPACAPGPVGRIEAAAARQADGSLRLSFRLAGDIGRLRLPARAPAARRDGLWRHACFEAFAGRAGEAAYREFNFSPSGEWASYDFSGYRVAAPALPAHDAPRIGLRRFPGVVELEASLPRAALPPDAALQIGLAAVVEDAQGALSYWALRHPAGRPDFHHRGGFVLTLDAPVRA